MRALQVPIVALLAIFTAGALLAQAQPGGAAAPPAPQQLTAEMKQDSDALRALAATTPALPLERVEIKITPPHVLGDVSATAVDRQGNIYIFHRP
jgi:hypothetical protein